MKWPLTSIFGSSQPPSGRAVEGKPGIQPEGVQQPVDVEREQVLLVELHRMEKRAGQEADILERERDRLEGHHRRHPVMHRAVGQAPGWTGIAAHRASNIKPRPRHARNADWLLMGGTVLSDRGPRPGHDNVVVRMTIRWSPAPFRPPQPSPSFK